MACLVVVGLLGVADPSRAELATATIVIEISVAAGRSPAGAVAELQATDDPALRRSHLIGDTQDKAVFYQVPPGVYRLTVSLTAFSDATLGVRVEPSMLVTLRADL